MKEVLSSVFFLVVAGGLIWGWNHGRQVVSENNDERPSIGALATETIVPVTAPPAPETVADTSGTETVAPSEKSDTPNPAAATLDIKVLNAGAAKGSAVRVQDFLKQNGYAKATASSAVGDYSGTTVYYLGSNESNATAVANLLSKDYSGVTVKIASSSKAEDGSASVVVMLGK